jgi:hypothetical protein
MIPLPLGRHRQEPRAAISVCPFAQIVGSFVARLKKVTTDETKAYSAALTPNPFDPVAAGLDRLR